MKNTQKQTRREQQRKKKQQQQFFLYGGLAIAFIAVAAVAVLAVNGTIGSGGLVGETVPILSRLHVPTDQDPGPYNSNPPAGGQHFPSTLRPAFYQESDLATLPAYPVGYLVHNLEHGYIIFWYNCQLSGVDCAELKGTIQTVMDEVGREKLIAFPWPNMDVPLAMTSWGQIQKFTTLDTDLMKRFALRNYNQAPEPNAN